MLAHSEVFLAPLGGSPADLQELLDATRGDQGLENRVVFLR